MLRGVDVNGNRIVECMWEEREAVIGARDIFIDLRIPSLLW